MYCTECGTENLEGSKFCRECGKPISAAPRRAGRGGAQKVRNKRPEDDAIADLLYDALRSFERGMLDAAFASCKQALRMDPSCSYAHSLLGLIFEKRSDEEAEKGNAEGADDYLHAAIRQVEMVIEQSPNSDADKDKLAELKEKSVEVQRIGVPKPKDLRKRVEATLERVPIQWVAGVAAFLLVFAILISVMRRGDSKPTKPVLAQGTQARPASQPSPAYQQPPAAATAPPAWAYRQPGPQAPRESYPMDESAPTSTTVQSPTQTPPPAIPNMISPVVPEPAPSTPAIVVQPPKPPKPKPESAKPVPPPAPAKPPAERAQDAYASGDYASAVPLYEQAIAGGADTAENHQELGMALYNLGRKQAAVSHFERAVQIYMDRKARGIDVASADRAIRTCKQYIDIARD